VRGGENLRGSELGGFEDKLQNYGTGAERADGGEFGVYGAVVWDLFFWFTCA
jgi:hypothetical protein